jgi:hypothetical protein
MDSFREFRRMIIINMVKLRKSMLVSKVKLEWGSVNFVEAAYFRTGVSRVSVPSC